MMPIRSNNDSLQSLDSIYEQAIVSLPKEVRIAYCERLIARCNFEISNNSANRKRLKHLIKVAKNEIRNLKEK
jgi:hypothetical protein